MCFLLSEVYITQLRRNAMGVGLVFEANLHTKEQASHDASQLIGQVFRRSRDWRERERDGACTNQMLTCCFLMLVPPKWQGAPKYLGLAGSGNDAK